MIVWIAELRRIVQHERFIPVVPKRHQPVEKPLCQWPVAYAAAPATTAPLCVWAGNLCRHPGMSAKSARDHHSERSTWPPPPTPTTPTQEPFQILACRN